MKNLLRLLLSLLSVFFMMGVSYADNKIADNQSIDASILDGYYNMELVALEEKAQGGDQWAQYYAGHRYIFGEGVTQDEAKGFSYILRASESGNQIAQYFVGNSYLQRNSLLGFDPKMAAHYLELSASQGYIHAHHALAYMYYLGAGVTENQERAFEHLNLSCVGGHKNDCFGWREDELRFYQSLF